MCKRRDELELPRCPTTGKLMYTKYIHARWDMREIVRKKRTTGRGKDSRIDIYTCEFCNHFHVGGTVWQGPNSHHKKKRKRTAGK